MNVEWASAFVPTSIMGSSHVTVCSRDVAPAVFSIRSRDIKILILIASEEHLRRNELTILASQTCRYGTCARVDKTSGAIRFALNFLWLLSLFQDKESDKSSFSLGVAPKGVGVTSRQA